METDQCAPLFRHIHSAMEKNANRLLKDQDLTFSQAQLLMALLENDGGSCTCKELEKHLQLAQSTTVGLVKRLEQKHFIECRPSPSDKRVKVVIITPQGSLFCHQAQAHMNEATEQMLSSLTPEEQAELLRLLEKVQNNLC